MGIVSVILFPKVDDKLKSNHADEAYNPHGIVPRAVRMIKEKYPQIVVCTDIALDPYSSMVKSYLIETDIFMRMKLYFITSGP